MSLGWGDRWVVTICGTRENHSAQPLCRTKHNQIENVCNGRKAVRTPGHIFWIMRGTSDKMVGGSPSPWRCARQPAAATVRACAICRASASGCRGADPHREQPSRRQSASRGPRRRDIQPCRGTLENTTRAIRRATRKMQVCLQWLDFPDKGVTPLPRPCMAELPKGWAGMALLL